MGKNQGVIVDTGPLVALLDKTDTFHEWAVGQVQHMKPPMLVCESVLSEAHFLLGGNNKSLEELLILLEKRAILLTFHLDEHINNILSLLRKYRNIPISLADACLIRMAELNDNHAVFTLDTDFKIYRKHGRRALKLISPGED